MAAKLQPAAVFGSPTSSHLQSVRLEERLGCAPCRISGHGCALGPSRRLRPPRLGSSPTVRPGTPDRVSCRWPGGPDGRALDCRTPGASPASPGSRRAFCGTARGRHRFQGSETTVRRNGPAPLGLSLLPVRAFVEGQDAAGGLQPMMRQRFRVSEAGDALGQRERGRSRGWRKRAPAPSWPSWLCFFPVSGRPRKFFFRFEMPGNGARRLGCASAHHCLITGRKGDRSRFPNPVAGPGAQRACRLPDGKCLY